MRSINKVIIIGNLTRDPEMRQTPNGQNVVTFGLATNREWVTKDGRKQNSAEFHDLVAWAKLADICQQYLKKGKLVYVEGYLKTRSWDTPEGTKKFRTEIVVQDMIMLDKRKSEDAEYFPEEEIITSDKEEKTEEPAETKEESPKEVKEEKEEKPEEPKEVKKKEPAAKKKEKPEEPKEEEKKEPEAKLDIDTDLGL